MTADEYDITVNGLPDSRSIVKPTSSASWSRMPFPSIVRLHKPDDQAALFRTQVTRAEDLIIAKVDGKPTLTSNRVADPSWKAYVKSIRDRVREGKEPSPALDVFQDLPWAQGGRQTQSLFYSVPMNWIRAIEQAYEMQVTGKRLPENELIRGKGGFFARGRGKSITIDGYIREDSKKEIFLLLSFFVYVKDDVVDVTFAEIAGKENIEGFLTVLRSVADVTDGFASPTSAFRADYEFQSRRAILNFGEKPTEIPFLARTAAKIPQSLGIKSTTIEPTGRVETRFFQPPGSGSRIDVPITRLNGFAEFARKTFTFYGKEPVKPKSALSFLLLRPRATTLMDGGARPSWDSVRLVYQSEDATFALTADQLNVFPRSSDD